MSEIISSIEKNLELLRARSAQLAGYKSVFEINILNVEAKYDKGSEMMVDCQDFIYSVNEEIKDNNKQIEKNEQDLREQKAKLSEADEKNINFDLPVDDKIVSALHLTLMSPPISKQELATMGNRKKAAEIANDYKKNAMLALALQLFDGDVSNLDETQITIKIYEEYCKQY